MPAAEETVTETEPVIPDEAVGDIVERIADMCDIAEKTGAGSRELDELYAVCGGLEECVNKRDTRMMRTLLVGLRGVVSASPLLRGALAEKTDELDETFGHFGV